MENLKKEPSYGDYLVAHGDVVARLRDEADYATDIQDGMNFTDLLQLLANLYDERDNAVYADKVRKWFGKSIEPLVEEAALAMANGESTSSSVIGQVLHDMTVGNPFHKRRDAVQNPATLQEVGKLD